MTGFGVAPLGSVPFGSGAAAPFQATQFQMRVDSRSSIQVLSTLPLQTKHATLYGDALAPESWLVQLDGVRIPVLAVGVTEFELTLHLWSAVKDLGHLTVSFAGALLLGGTTAGNADIAATPPEAKNATTADKRDYKSHQFTGPVIGGLDSTNGDYGTEGGWALRRKTLTRRLSSVQGSFTHARSFGLTTAVKTPYAEADLLNFVETIRSACLKEPDAVSATVKLDTTPTVITAHVSVLYGDKTSTTASANYNPSGSYLGT